MKREWLHMLHVSMRVLAVDLFALLRPSLFLGFLLLTGALGYVWIEGWEPLAATYMTVITVSTVGFGEVRPLSDAGQIFTILLILGGVVFYGLALDSLLKLLVNRQFASLLEEARMRDRVRKMHDHIIICGGGRMAMAMAAELQRGEQSFLILDPNPEALVARARRAGEVDWTLLERDALLEESLVEAHIDTARGLAAVLPGDADNLFVVLSARALNAELQIETRIARESTRQKMLQAGADRVLSPYTVSGEHMARSLMHPDAAAGADVLELALDGERHEYRIESEALASGDPRIGQSLGELRAAAIQTGDRLVVGVRLVSGHSELPGAPDRELGPGMQILWLRSGRDK